MKTRRILTALLAVFTGALMLTSCNKIYSDAGPVNSLTASDVSKTEQSQQEDSSSSETQTQADLFLQQNFPSNGSADLLNFRTPAEGEEIAVIHTSMGDIKVMFFPEVAPKAVENFKTLVKEGYYNTTDAQKMLFHRVVADFIIQSGDPTGTGAEGKSSFGAPFEDEFSEQALHFRGALSMANSGPNTNESQFFIVQAPATTLSADSWNLFRFNDSVQKAFPESVMKKYEEVGGAPWLDFDHTVFGQVIEGMEVVDAISAVPVTNDKFQRPQEEILIQSISLEAYTAPAPADNSSAAAS